MKKFILGSVVLLLISLPAFAGGFKLHFGPAITNIRHGEDLPSDFEQKSLFQFAGGVGFELNFTPNFALEFDLMFMPGGAKFEYTGPGGGYLAYKGYGIALPVLLKVSFLSGTTPYLIGGASLAYSLSQKLIIDAPGYHDEEDVSEDMNRFQYSLVFGGGVEFVVAAMNFLAEFRYIMGLSNLIKEPWADEWGKISTILILIGYKF